MSMVFNTFIVKWDIEMGEVISVQFTTHLLFYTVNTISKFLWRRLRNFGDTNPSENLLRESLFTECIVLALPMFGHTMCY